MADIHSIFTDRIVLKYKAVVGTTETAVYMQEFVAFLHKIKAAGYMRRWLIEAVFEKYERERAGKITGVSMSVPSEPEQSYREPQPARVAPVQPQAIPPQVDRKSVV